MFKKMAVRAGVLPMVGLVGSAHAALPTDFTTAISDGQADAVSAAFLILGALVAIFAVKLIRRAM